MLSKGANLSEYFPDVVKNVVVKSIEVKKMVYIYLVHYADHDATCREIALLSINSFQKDLSGSNQLIRGLALRVMTSIRVPDIIQIQLLAARKCASDSSPYVRKCAANALPKIFNLDPEQITNLKQILDKLLRDSSTMVLGSAVAAFNEICPTSYEIIHRSYRKLCHLLADMDEWSQVSVLEVMTRYVRNQFTDPAPGTAVVAKIQAKNRSTAAVQGRSKAARKRRVVKKAFYSDEEDESDEEEVQTVVKTEIGSVFTGGDAEVDGDIDPDHRLILKSSLPLLKSRNSGVVLGVCSLHYYCGTQSNTTMQQIGKAMVRILRNRREVQYVVLHSINSMARDKPHMFVPYLSDFFVKSTDPIFNRLIKLEILTSLCTKENIKIILKELQIYIKENNTSFVCATVKAVGRVADADSSVSDACMEGLMHLLLCNKVPAVISECVVVLRQILQQNIQSMTSAKILKQLVKLLIVSEENPRKIIDSTARSSVIWLIGELSDALKKVAPDILRILAINYVDESTETKMQIMNLAIKLALQFPDDEPVQLLMTYVLEMSRYDLNTDLRDRARFMTSMMGLAPASESEENPEDESALAELADHAKTIMLAPKLPPVTLLGSVDFEGLPNFNIGSLSALVGHYVSGFENIMNWPEHQPDSSVRDSTRYTNSNDNSDNVSPFSSQKITQNPLSAGSDDENDFKVFYEKGKAKGNDSSSSSSEEESDEEESEDEEDDSEEESDSDESSNSSEQSDSETSNSESDSEDSDDSSVDQRKRTSKMPLSQQNQSAVKLTSNTQPTNLLNLSQPSKVTQSHGTTLQPIRRVAPQKKRDAFDQDMVDILPLQSNQNISMIQENSLDLLPTTTTTTNELADGLLDLNISNKEIPQDLLLASAASQISQIPVSPMSYNPIQSGNNSPVGNILSQFDKQPPVMAAPSMQPAMNSIQLTPPANPSTNHLTPPSHEKLSQPRFILKPETGGGLSVNLVYRRDCNAVAFAGASCIYLTVKNHKEYPQRRVKINFPNDLRKTTIPDIPVLNPGQEVVFPVEIVLFNHASKQVKLDIRSDQGAYVGILTVNEWDLICPNIISTNDFEACCQRLKGFGETLKTYTYDQLGITYSEDLENILFQKISREYNFYVVQGLGVGELLFAGVVRKGYLEEKVYLTVLIQESNMSIRLNCEEAVMAAGFLDDLKKLLSSKK